ncbi:TPA: hypothetical protein ENX78_13395 [Candidatus Poribacteria bacterium]|jgi:hypothetical protein|nr:hypothetical protein [Candidatus Poribacteria bacterium]
MLYYVEKAGGLLLFFYKFWYDIEEVYRLGRFIIGDVAAKMRWQRFKFAIIMILLIVFLSLLGLAFDYLIVSPLHEYGHALFCVALGIQVKRIEWGQIQYISTNDWRENVMLYAGGLCAAFALFLLYVFLNIILNSISKQALQQKFKRIFTATKFVIKTIVGANLMAQLAAGILEGSNPSLYQALSKNPPLLLIIYMTFTAISLTIHVKRISRVDIAVLLPKT